MSENQSRNNPQLLSVGIRDVQFGERVTVVQPSNLYECEIGDDCFIGPFVEIQSGVKIGKRTRIQSHSFLCELVCIGEDCFVGHGVMFINDLLRSGRPSFRDESMNWAPTVIGDNVMLGSQTTILPVTICSHVIVGAGAVVTKDITESGIYVGNPARRIRAFPVS